MDEATQRSQALLIDSEIRNCPVAGNCLSRQAILFDVAQRTASRLCKPKQTPTRNLCAASSFGQVHAKLHTASANDSCGIGFEHRARPGKSGPRGLRRRRLVSRSLRFRAALLSHQGVAKSRHARPANRGGENWHVSTVELMTCAIENMRQHTLRPICATSAGSCPCRCRWASARSAATCASRTTPCTFRWVGGHCGHSLEFHHRRQAQPRSRVGMGSARLAGRWLVNGSSKGMVELTIDPPMRARLTGVPITLRTLWVSVTDPDALIAACAKTAWGDTPARAGPSRRLTGAVRPPCPRRWPPPPSSPCPSAWLPADDRSPRPPGPWRCSRRWRARRR